MEHVAWKTYSTVAVGDHCVVYADGVPREHVLVRKKHEYGYIELCFLGARLYGPSDTRVAVYVPYLAAESVVSHNAACCLHVAENGRMDSLLSHLGACTMLVRIVEKDIKTEDAAKASAAKWSTGTTVGFIVSRGKPPYAVGVYEPATVTDGESEDFVKRGATIDAQRRVRALIWGSPKSEDRAIAALAARTGVSVADVRAAVAELSRKKVAQKEASQNKA